MVATMLPHPPSILRSPIRFGEVLVIAQEGSRDSSESTLVQDRRSMKEIPQRDEQENKADTSKEDIERSLTVKDLYLSHVQGSLREPLKNMFRKHSSMWDGSFAEIRTTEHIFELIPRIRPLAPASRRAGPKTREIE